jgi:phosphoglycerol transferase MdoB-like AlkP superfamily enzyme
MIKVLSLDWRKEFYPSGILPKHLSYVVRMYLNGILCFTLFRLILFIQEFHQLHYLPTDQGTWLVLKAFIMGLRFDTVVSGYILTVPFLLLCADAFAGWNSKLLYRVVFWLVTAGYLFGFFVSAADIPYFHHFYARITMSVLISVDSGSSNLLSGMVFREWRYYWVLGPFALISWFFIVQNRRLLRNVLYRRSDFPLTSALWAFPVFALLIFMGIWGRFTPQSHIDAGTAYFSDYGFTNMLGLNPVYTFGLSYVNSLSEKKQEVHFMGDGEAVRNVQEFLKVTSQEYNSPIARQVSFPDSAVRKPNIVVVMMESMSANKMSRYGNPHNLTPFMDSLATAGYVFDSVFTSGIHTFAGIYSTLFAQPVVKRQHPMVKIAPQSGFSNTLKQHGYSTVYFTTHDEAFDNTGQFLRENSFDKIVSMADYPKEKILSSLGVPDDYLYEHAIGDLDELHESGKPFFAAMMTGSDHGPYIIPKYFTPKWKEATLGIVEYVDWSVRKFLRLASGKSWFDNTLFVFVADHGAALDKRYDMPLSYVHTPLIFYAPKLLGEPKEFKMLGNQVDIFPTVMGILQLPYVNNTFGIDLFKEKRPYSFAYADDKYAVLDAQYLYVLRENGVASLYHYPDGDMKNYLEAMPEKAVDMQRYGESVFQAAQWLRKNGKTGVQ